MATRQRNRNHSQPKAQKYTIADFNAEFPNDDACLNHVFYARWPDGITVCDSKTCGNAERRHHRVSGRTAFACDYCGKHIYPLAGTIFEKTTTPLKLWFYAMYLMGSTRCGISAKQIQRETGVTYKTAWRMFKQIRTLMSEDIRLEGSSVECDETYVGGLEKNKHLGRRGGNRGRSTNTKATVFGIVERKGRVIARVTPDAKEKTILPIMAERILPASTVYTDSYTTYDKVGAMPQGYAHHRINHSERVYVMGHVHTQTIEGFWSLLKRGIGGVYHSVSRKYLQSYCDEYAYRYNHRDDRQPMFTSLLSEVCERAS
ncbi:MAG TPA: IS1595 family transposase [Acidobacteriaceae bacterium]|nr:IS1595 family transposase [Acidobacteriaceae bacterium]